MQNLSVGVFSFSFKLFFSHKPICFIFLYGTLYEAKDWNAELNPRGFVWSGQNPCNGKSSLLCRRWTSCKGEKTVLVLVAYSARKNMEFPSSKWQDVAFCWVSPNRYSCSTAIQPPPDHLLPWAVSPVPFCGSWQANMNVWNVASLSKSIILPLPMERGGQLPLESCDQGFQFHQ